ncbi:MAG: hypothetical protein ACI93T_001090 [Porticoccaceae bacterium]|jgi:hypothetical protein
MASQPSERLAELSPHEVATAANGSRVAMCPSLVKAKADSGTEHLDRPRSLLALPASACDASGPKASLCFSSHTTDFESTVVIACSPSGNDRNFTTRHTPTRLISTKQPTIRLPGFVSMQFCNQSSTAAIRASSGRSACKDENHPNRTIAPCRMIPRSRSPISG